MLKIYGEPKPEMPAVLCIAGNLCSPGVFDRITVQEGVQKLYLDYLQSAGPWDMDSLGRRLLNTVRELKLGPVVLAGYSAGGVLAISAACKGPDLIAGLLLSNTGPCSLGHGSPGFADELREHFDDESYIRKFLASCFYGDADTELVDKLWDYTRTVEREAAYEVSKSLREVDYRQNLKSFKNPVTIVHGLLDTRRGMDSVAMMQESLKQAEVKCLLTGHTPMAEDPVGYQEALDCLLGRVPGFPGYTGNLLNEQIEKKCC